MKNYNRTNARRPISVLIVTDNHIIRSGLRQILDSETSIQVFGEVSVEQAIALEIIPGRHPDVILVDLDYRGNDALCFIENLRSLLKKDSGILVLSDLADYEVARKALALGAAGVVLKMQPPAVLIAAIKDVCANNFHESFQNNVVIRKEITNGHRISKIDSGAADEMRRIQSLTAREREIIGLVGLGLKNKDIANRLSISDITVRHHLTSIFCKLGVSDRQKLLILAHRNGLANLNLSSVEPA